MSETETILKNAILLEKRGKAFYQKVADQAQSDVVKEFFQFMADEEVIHVKMLNTQFKQYKSRKGFSRMDFKPADHGGIATSVLTKDLKKEIAAADFEAAAIGAAISMEKHAIELYSSRAAATADLQEKKLYQWLADWEQEHLNALVAIDKELKEKIWNDNNFWPS
ncbi:ferritin family protein [Desulfococcaceae bacterium HSG9]|nr:ferritin family protein [Desulfococcaceae bacterium HSG9]